MAEHMRVTDSVGIRPKATYDFRSIKARGSENLMFLLLDYKNYLQSKRIKSMILGDGNIWKIDLWFTCKILINMTKRLTFFAQIFWNTWYLDQVRFTIIFLFILKLYFDSYGFSVSNIFN